MAGMDRWAGKVALVTGASAGIGAAIVEDLVENGLKVVGLARRAEKVEEIKEKVKGAKGELFAFKGDVAKAEDVEAVFAYIEEKFGKIHVLINNAGIARNGTIRDGNFKNFEDVINVNLIGLTRCTQKALLLMKKTGVEDGHIININSVAGHTVINLPEPTFNVYPASKFAVTALTETIRHELRYQKTKTKITSISPGVVATEIGEASLKAAEPGTITPEKIEEMKKFYESFPSLEAKDISNAVVYVLGTPPHVQIHEMIIKPVGEPF